MPVPTEGETFAEMLDHLRKCQSLMAMMGHLRRANDDHRNADGWIAMSEMMGQVCQQITKLAMGRMQ